MEINPLIGGTGASPIAALHERAREMSGSGPLLDFSVGDPLEPTPSLVVDALHAAVPTVSQYPLAQGILAAREAVAGYVERRFGVYADPNRHVLITGGSKEAIFHTPAVLCEPGQRVICPSPGYTPYVRGTLHAGAEPVVEVLAGDFAFRSTDLERLLPAQMLWINYPHNPTGAVLSRTDLQGLVRAAQANDVWLCSDECYPDLFEGDPPPSALEFAEPDFTGVLAFFSASKRSGMTGYRVGAVVGDAQAIEAMRLLKQSAGTVPPEFVQRAAAAAWNDDVHPAERSELFAQKRAILRRAFEENGYEVVGSTAGLYIWIKVGDDLAMAEQLLNARIVVAPGRAFGPGGEGFIRLALVPTLQQCEQAEQEIRECLTNN
jgi:succinyldiaminopimelate transaminase